MGEEVPRHEDRRYTHEEIHTLVQGASIRLKALILLMASSGVRIGAIPGLNLSHLEKRGDLYKINVYKGQKGKGQYYTFCTPEAAKAIDSYLEFRERCGEKINRNSNSNTPLFRKDFNSDDPSQARFQIEEWNKKAIALVKTKVGASANLSLVYFPALNSIFSTLFNLRSIWSSVGGCSFSFTSGLGSSLSIAGFELFRIVFFIASHRSRVCNIPVLASVYLFSFSSNCPNSTPQE